MHGIVQRRGGEKNDTRLKNREDKREERNRGQHEFDRDTAFFGAAETSPKKEESPDHAIPMLPLLLKGACSLPFLLTGR